MKLGDLAAARGRLPVAEAPFAARVDARRAGHRRSCRRTARDRRHGRTLRCGRLARSGRAGAGQRRVEHGQPDSRHRPAHRRLHDRRHEFRRDAARSSASKAVRPKCDIDGAAVSGILRIPGQDIVRQGVTARFDRFHWPESAPDAHRRGRQCDPRDRAGRAAAAAHLRSTISCSARRASARPCSKAVRSQAACMSKNSKRSRRT